MTSSDVRDVLDLGTHSGPRPAKKQKTTASRPNLKGLAREVQSLGGDNPIAIVPQTTAFKKKRLANRKPPAKWELRPFQNSARGDNGALTLRHWRRKADAQPGGAGADADDKQQPSQEGGEASTTQKTEDGTTTNPESREASQPIEDSTFAKYNVHVNIPQYSNDQYVANLENPDWTKDETDYLMGLVKDYELRWPVIWDRYEYVPEAINGEASADGDESKAIIPVPKPRSTEDLKARYYEIASKMMAAQTPVQYMTKEEFALYETMTNFNPQQEKSRKEFATNALSRTKEEANEEESLLLEIKRIMQRSATFNEERRELYNRLDYPHTDQDISTFKTSAGLQTLLQNMMAIDKNKRRKSLMGSDGASPSQQQGQQGQQQTPAEGGAASAGGRRESSAANNSSNNKDTPTAAAAAASSTKNAASSAAQTPTAEKGGQNNKKGAQPPQERRKLSEAEKRAYGISYHDRLQSGATFRYERINKMFTSKSGQQQNRIINILTELDIPGRLIMPTPAVTAQFEQLLGSVHGLIDARKITDKIDGEIKVEAAKKADREEKERAAEKEAQADPNAAASSEEKGKEGEAAAATAEQATADEAGAPKTDGEGDSKAEGNKDGEVPAAASTGTEGAGATDEDDKSARPGSSGNHKRSASVLSAVSDKSAKRQKK